MANRNQSVPMKGIRMDLSGVDDAHINRDTFAGWPAGSVNSARSPHVKIALAHAPYQRVLDEFTRTGAAVIALMEVDPDSIHMYGAAAVEPIEGSDAVRVTGLVEKPAKEDAPSNLAIIGRYVLPASVFEILERTEPGKGGEIQLTDALQELATADGGPGVVGVVFGGRRYDTGDRVDYIKAIVQLAADRDDLGSELRPWLKDFAERL